MAIFHYKIYLKFYNTPFIATTRQIFIHHETLDVAGKQPKQSRCDKYATNPHTLKVKLFTEKYI